MRWIKDHIWLIIIAMILIAAFVVGLILRQKDRPTLKGLVQDLVLEKKVIDAKAKVAKATAKDGHTNTSNKIKQDHAEAIAKMKEDDQKKVEELSDDPEALVDFIIRVSS